ncbi:MAG TPA: tRNA pseudouridine(55) synthase TruB [Chloroflexi bacterium]|nr:tRNA pseudouridine(55) synthase TruB [Chloroflexota bacterium]
MDTELQNQISGVLVIDKPVGYTSHDIVQIVRRGTQIKRAGHTGTLDPRASGVLVVLVGPAVRLSEYVSASNKRYQAVMQLGANTDTYDAEGVVTGTFDVNVTEEEFVKALEKFTGEIEQVPPPYSAVKVRGRKAYDMARKGETVELEPRTVTVHELELLEWAPPEAVVDVFCSSGTYVRSLAYDLGAHLGCGAHLIGLRRTRSGQFTLRNAIPLQTLREAFDQNTWYQYVIPAAEALSDWYTVVLQDEEIDQVVHGHRVAAEGECSEMARAITQQGELVALLEYVPEDHEWQPKKVFWG